MVKPLSSVAFRRTPNPQLVPAQALLGDRGDQWQGQNICAACRHDDTGQWFPDCLDIAEALRDTVPDITSVDAHPITCDRYWTTSQTRLWLCVICETAAAAIPW